MAEKEKRSDNSFIGAAGVHYAAYKLTRKGMIALPTVRNTPGTDLIVTSHDGRRHVNIQVKTTKSKTATFWIICSTKKFEERKNRLGKIDYFLLLRPRRADDPDTEEMSEFEGFLLTATEAKQEMQAHLDYWRKQGKKSPCSVSAFTPIRDLDTRVGTCHGIPRINGENGGRDFRCEVNC